jgi:dephospho-CoA kinase
MLLIGLTGSIGMGKSTIAKRFRDRGIGVCDADALVHDLYAGAAVGPIGAAFPGSIISGKVDRAQLSAALLKDPSGFKRLEAIVHPLVQAAERACLQQYHQRGDEMAVLEVPLLLETGGEKRVDVTVVVSAPADVQRARVLARPGMTEEKYAEILRRQMSDEDKRMRADFIVDTGGTIADSWAGADKVIAAVRRREAQAFMRFWS